MVKGVDTKENYNDYKDDDGCPDKKPIPKLEKKGAKLILKGVYFETASAALTTESYAILHEVIPGIKDNKEVELEIRVYTDSQGSASYNQMLSKRRATTVMQCLVNKGIEASRLRDVGYGEKDPFGHCWSIASHKWVLSPEEMQERMEEWLKSISQ